MYILEKQHEHISRKCRKKRMYCILFKVRCLLPKYAKTHHYRTNLPVYYTASTNNPDETIHTQTIRHVHATAVYE